jgi:hypothetical protein
MQWDIMIEESDWYWPTAIFGKVFWDGDRVSVLVVNESPYNVLCREDIYEVETPIGKIELWTNQKVFGVYDLEKFIEAFVVPAKEEGFYVVFGEWLPEEIQDALRAAGASSTSYNTID